MLLIPVGLWNSHQMFEQGANQKKSTHPQSLSLDHPPKTVPHHSGIPQVPNGGIVWMIPLVEIHDTPLQQIVHEGVILLLLPTSMVVVQILVGHQCLMPQLVIKTKVLEPLVPVMLKVELVDNLKGTKVRGAKRPLTPSLSGRRDLNLFRHLVTGGRTE